MTIEINQSTGCFCCEYISFGRVFFFLWRVYEFGDSREHRQMLNSNDGSGCSVVTLSLVSTCVAHRCHTQPNRHTRGSHFKTMATNRVSDRSGERHSRASPYYTIHKWQFFRLSHKQSIAGGCSTGTLKICDRNAMNCN